MVNGTITRRINSVQNDLYSEFCDMYTASDFEYQYQKLVKAKNTSRRPSILAELYKMLTACQIPFEKNKNNRYYGTLIEKFKADNQLDLPDKILKELYKRYKVYPSPQEYMLRIVNRLENALDNWTMDSLRLRILKRFIKYGDYLSSAGFRGSKFINDYVKGKLGKKKLSTDEILTYLDDEIFDALKTADKTQKKPQGKYGLLKLADDLAEGKFRVGGGTKQGLYLFAMVYNMTYSMNENSESFDPATDLEKNLFRDYYSNNLIRFITDTYNGRNREFEADPSGQGINYKHFAEIIYIYFIVNDYKPLEKIKLSSEMIERVKDSPQKKHLNSSTKTETIFFKNRLIDENVLHMIAANFEEFIRENYNCDTFLGDHSIGIMQTDISQNKAFQNYNSILNEIQNLGFDLKNCNYGLYFADVSLLNEEAVLKIIGDDSDKNHCGEFIELLRCTHRFLGGFLTDSTSGSERQTLSEMKNKFLFIDTPNDMTRTALITAYYYLHNCRREIEDSDRKNFVEFFKEFSFGINPYLEDSGYQTLNVKNFFDFAVVFSSYAYTNG